MKKHKLVKILNSLSLDEKEEMLKMMLANGDFDISISDKNNSICYDNSDEIFIWQNGMTINLSIGEK